MRFLKRTIFFVLLVGIGQPVFAHGDHGHESDKKSGTKSKKKSEKSSDSHEHESPFSLELGVSVTHSFSKSSSGGSSSGSSESGGGHSHFTLHGADEGGGATPEVPSNDGDGEGGSGTTPPAFDPVFTARLKYNFVPSMGALFSVGYALESGATDPELGLTMNNKLGKRLSLGSSLTASIPASIGSQLNYKITTIKATTGPTYQKGRFSTGLAASAAYAWYSKTVVYDEDPAPSTPTTLVAPVLLHGDDSHVDTPGAVGPSDNNLDSQDREFSRWGLLGSMGYRIFRSFRMDSSVGINLVKTQFGASIWATQATVTQLTFTYKSMSAYLGFMLTGSGASITAPSSPSANIGIGYTI